MSSSTSPPSRSGRQVYAGTDIAADTGASLERPAATTRIRRSRSVRIPSDPSPSSTTIDVAGAAVIIWAAAAIDVSGRQTKGAPRISALTGWWAWSTVGSGAAAGPAASAHGSSSERVTNRNPAGAARSSRAI